jgi:hypothetical protein
MKFLKFFFITGTQRWGSFMWLGTHYSMTQTDWHWVIETSVCIGLDLLLIIGVFIEWKETHKHDSNTRDTTDTLH